jgi:hypothetical protein
MSEKRKKPFQSTSSSLFEAIQALETFTILDTEAKQDLLYMLEHYAVASRKEDILDLAQEHPDLTRDIAFALARAQQKARSHEVRLESTWSTSYIDARDDIMQEAKANRDKAYKPTEEQVKCRANLNASYQALKHEMNQWNALVSIFENLNRGLVSRALLIRSIVERTEADDELDDDI